MFGKRGSAARVQPVPALAHHGPCGKGSRSSFQVSFAGRCPACICVPLPYCRVTLVTKSSQRRRPLGQCGAWATTRLVVLRHEEEQ